MTAASATAHVIEVLSIQMQEGKEFAAEAHRFVSMLAGHAPLADILDAAPVSYRPAIINAIIIVAETY